MTSEFGMAVHALTFLNHKGEIVSSEALAKNICTNPARVRKVMAKLKKAGLVDTKEVICPLSSRQVKYLKVSDKNTYISFWSVGIFMHTISLYIF